MLRKWRNAVNNKPKLAKAKEYRELSSLPRRELDPKTGKHRHLGVNEAGGEAYPLNTPIADLAAFGLAHTLLLSMMYWLCVLTAGMALVVLPNMIFYASPQYGGASTNDRIASICDEGSSFDCVIHMAIASVSAVCPDTNIATVELPFGEVGKQSLCPMTYELGIVDVIALSWFLVGVVLLRKHRQKVLIALDLSVQTAQDCDG
jgi:hypothetical protein